MKKKSFIIFKDSLSVLEDLNDKQRGQLFYAIYQYQIGNEIELSPLIKIAFSPFKNQFIRDNEKWDSKSDERTAKARKAGIESARKRKQLKATKSTKSNSVVENQLNQPVTVSVTDTVIESVKDNVKDLKHYVSLWNEKANEFGLSKIISLNESRKTKLRTRLKEPNFDFEQIIDKIQIDTPFLISGDWRVDFDFIIKNDNNYIKILEGKYKKELSNNNTQMRTYDE